MSEEYPKIRGRTVQERNASIEHILKSLARRTVKRAVVYVPPVPLFINCADVGEDNIIGEVLLPFSGTLKDLFVRVGEVKTTRAKIAVSIISDIASTTMHFSLSKQSERLLMEMEVDAGSTLQLVLEEGNLNNILVATAIYPKLEDHVGHEYLLEHILREEREEDAS